MTSKVSVVIPIYNVENYLRKCLDSLVNQTYKNLEFICVNDGSTDGSLEILKEYATKDSRFIIINQENQGVACAKNNGLNAASGDYLSFVDPDDWVGLNYYEEVVKEFIATNCDVVQLDYTVAYSNNKCEIHCFDKFLKNNFNFCLKNHQIYSSNSFKHLEYFPILFIANDKVYDLSYIRKNQICFGVGNYAEDSPFSIKNCVLAKKIVYLKKSFYFNFVRYNSLSKSKNYSSLYSLKLNIKIISDFIKDTKNNYFNDCLNNFIYNIYEFFYQNNCPAIKKTSLRKEIKKIFPEDRYKKFVRKALFINETSFLEQIFSLKNEKHRKTKEKVLRILGKRFILKRSPR